MDLATISQLILGVCQLLINVSAVAIIVAMIVLFNEFPKVLEAAVITTMQLAGEMNTMATTQETSTSEPLVAFVDTTSSPRSRRRGASAGRD